MDIMKNIKLVVQVPCLNEEKTLPLTLQRIPRNIPGVSKVEILIIDDGSTDRTIEIANASGVDHVVRFANHKGLARAFAAGLEKCVELGADIIVNTDADNQYEGGDIPKLIEPILKGEADIVVGVRNIRQHQEFSFAKKQLQKLGSWVVRKLSGTKIKDATSGFRAYSREAAIRMNVLSDYSYTLETIIQAGRMDMAISQVPIRTNPKTRESRLFKNVFYYIKRSVATMLKVYIVYQPLKVFFSIGSLVFFSGLLIGCRFLYFFLMGQRAGHIQSLILASILIMLGFQIFVLGLLAHLISANRFLSENILLKVKRIETED